MAGAENMSWKATTASAAGSPLEVLRLAACRVDTPALTPREDHHALVAAGVQHIAVEEATTGGQLGSRAGPRYKVYQRLSRIAGARQGTLFGPQIVASLGSTKSTETW